MGYYDEPETVAQRMGQMIYKRALSDRRGYRPDQVGIDESDSVCGEIFQDIGQSALDVL